MLKLTKKADYALIAVRHLAEHAEGGACSAKDLADAYGMPPQALAKILQRLAKAGVLASHHGTNGGYALARPANAISVFEVVSAIDGPMFLTSCFDTKHECYQSKRCTVREPLRRVNEGIQGLLSRMMIADMREPADEQETEKEMAPAELVSLA